MEGIIQFAIFSNEQIFYNNGNNVFLNYIKTIQNNKDFHNLYYNDIKLNLGVYNDIFFLCESTENFETRYIDEFLKFSQYLYFNKKEDLESLIEKYSYNPEAKINNQPERLTKISMTFNKDVKRINTEEKCLGCLIS